MRTALLSNLMLLHTTSLLHSGYVSVFDIAEYCTKGRASSTSPKGTCTTLNKINTFHCPNDCIMKLHMHSADNVDVTYVLWPSVRWHGAVCTMCAEQSSRLFPIFCVMSQEWPNGGLMWRRYHGEPMVPCSCCNISTSCMGREYTCVLLSMYIHTMYVMFVRACVCTFSFQCFICRYFFSCM